MATTEAEEADRTRALQDAAANLAKLLPASGPGLSWADVVDDNDLAGLWAPAPTDLPASVHTLLLDTYRRSGSVAAARLIESASRLADHRHRRRRGDESFLLDQLGVYVRILGVEFSQVMNEIKWREVGPATTDMSPDEVRVLWAFDLVPLRRMYDRLREMENRQAAGLLLEQRLLWRLFEVFGLEPGAAFRVDGQQIDGSFKHRGSVFLLEAKWTSGKVGAAETQVFDHKVKTKSRNTRGLMVSVAGYTDEALKEYRTSNSPVALLIDGNHLERVLDGTERLDDMLSRLSDHFDRTGEAYVPVL